MASQDRRAREKAKVHEKILGAARGLFLKHGYEAVSLRKIAEAIDYTAPAIYTHFKDKREVLMALCRADFGELTAGCLKLASVADPVERIRQAGRSYIRFAVEHPQQYQLMFMRTHPPDIEPAPEDLAKMNDPDQDGYALLRASVQQAIAEGRLRPELRDAELIAQVLWASMHGIASLQITHEHDPWVTWRSLDRRTSLMIDSVLRGMLLDPTQLDRPAATKGGRR